MMDRIEAGSRLYRTKVLREECSAAALLARFEATRAFRESRLAAARRGRQLVPVGVAGVILSFVSMNVSVYVGAVLVLGSLAFLVAAICRVRAGNVDSRAEVFLEPLLRALGEDFGTRPVRVFASIAPLQSKEFLQHTEKRSVEGYSSWTDRIYGRVLLTFACRLRDDSRVWLTVREKMLASKRRRWGGRRKNKLKTKLRSRSTASIVMRVAPPAGWQGAGAKVAFPDDCRIRWTQRGETRVVEIRLKEKLKGEAGVPSDRTLRLLQLVYQGFAADGAGTGGGTP